MARKKVIFLTILLSLPTFHEQFSGYNMMVVDTLVCFSLIKVNLGYHKPK